MLAGNPTDPDDMKAAHALQDQIKVEQKEPGELELPDWDYEGTLVETRQMIGELAKPFSDTSDWFGKIEDVDPIKHLLGAA